MWTHFLAKRDQTHCSEHKRPTRRSDALKPVSAASPSALNLYPTTGSSTFRWMAVVTRWVLSQARCETESARHLHKRCFEKPRTQQVTAIRIGSAAKSRTRGNITWERSGPHKRPPDVIAVLQLQLQHSDPYARCAQLARLGLGLAHLGPCSTSAIFSSTCRQDSDIPESFAMH